MYRRETRSPKKIKQTTKHHIKYQQTSHHQSNRRSQGRRFTTEQRKRKSRIRMGRISFLSKIPPPPPILAAHYHRSYHYNASNASPVSFLLLIATVAAGEVLAIFVCKIIADYGTLLLGWPSETVERLVCHPQSFSPVVELKRVNESLQLVIVDVRWHPLFRPFPPQLIWGCTHEISRTSDSLEPKEDLWLIAPWLRHNAADDHLLRPQDPDPMPVMMKHLRMTRTRTRTKIAAPFAFVIWMQKKMTFVNLFLVLISTTKGVYLVGWSKMKLVRCVEQMCCLTPSLHVDLWHPVDDTSYGHKAICGARA